MAPGRPTPGSGLGQGGSATEGSATAASAASAVFLIGDITSTLRIPANTGELSASGES